LLDEATSALDAITEQKVLNNLKALEGITLFIVTHKKAAEKVCNCKIEVKGGKFTLLPIEK
jgi:ATP-binding cassette subfamily B protein